MNVIDAGSAATLRNCAILGSPGSGVGAKDATLSMFGCLVAAAWGTGIEIEGGSDAEIRDCEVRNCYHRGITISPASGKVSISGCRISGSAWHGIRYDDCSPKITGNLIFGNARSGIYVSGETAGEISGNLLVRNEMDGISCWDKSRDRIERNTFADNSRDSIVLCGMASPMIRGNIFLGASISQEKPDPKRLPNYKVGTPVVEHNLFWGGAWPWQSGAGGKDEEQTPGSPPRENFVEDPRFGDGYVLPADSTLPGRQIGPEKVMSFESPYPLQPEEQAIIPRASRDWQDWKR